MELETEIFELESQIDAMLKRLSELFNENDLLRKKLATLLQEKAISDGNNEKALGKIKQIIHQLKQELTDGK